MPIQFRCPNCNQMLSISTRRAGSMIVCPACTEETLVPAADGAPVPPAATLKPSIPATKPQGLASGADDLARDDFSHSRGASGKQAHAASNRPTASAYASGAGAAHASLFDAHADAQHDDDEHDDEEHPPHNKKKRFMDDTVDMTAMVDVTFLLLIFFMVTASFAAQKVFETSPPEQESEGAGAVSSVEEMESNSVIVEIDASDRMEIDGQPISGLYELRETLSAKLATEEKTELLIQAQYQSTHGMVVSVTDAAMDVGMQKVRRISRQSDE